MVIISSRLTVSFELHNLVDHRVEILGFTENSRKDYIEQALQDNSQLAKKLSTYLKNNPAIDAHCYIPLNMAILLNLFTDLENADLSAIYTQTEINQK